MCFSVEIFVLLPHAHAYFQEDWARSRQRFVPAAGSVPNLVGVLLGFVFGSVSAMVPLSTILSGSHHFPGSFELFWASEVSKPILCFCFTFTWWSCTTMICNEVNTTMICNEVMLKKHPTCLQNRGQTPQRLVVPFYACTMYVSQM